MGIHIMQYFDFLVSHAAAYWSVDLFHATDAVGWRQGDGFWKI